jgi:predicted Zn-dependent peptidase
VIPAAVASVFLAGPHLTRLPNGIPVIVDAGTGEAVSIQVLVRTDDLAPLELGAAETLASALLGETENYSLQELRRLAWSVGGSIVCESAGDCIRLEVSTTRDRLRPAAAFISDTLRNPTFKHQALAAARSARLRFQDWVDRTPPLRAVRTEWSRKGIGPSDVGSLTAEQARALHSKVFRPDRVAIAVVGTVNSEDFASILGASLGHWQPNDLGRSEPLRADAPRPSPSFAASAVTVKGPSPTAKEFAAWVTACVVIAEGKLSFLNRKYRMEAGRTYVLGSAFTFREGASYCTFYVSGSETAPGDLKDSVRAFVPTEGDIVRARAYLAGRYLVGGPTDVGYLGAFSTGHDTDSSRAFWLAWWELKGAGIQRDATFTDSVSKVTDEAVIDVCRTWKFD